MVHASNFAGLDSSNAAKVVDILAGLAATGVGVVLTIHQPRPDVFRLMHRVLLLSGRGQVMACNNHVLFRQRFMCHLH